MKLTSTERIGRSQLNSSVLRTFRWGQMLELARTLTLKSPLSPRDIQTRLAAATDIRAPAAARVLEIRPYAGSPTGLPERGALLLDQLDQSGFRFRFSFQRVTWPIVGTIAPEGTGASVTVKVPHVSPGSVLDALFLGLFWLVAWRSHNVKLIGFVGVVTVLVIPLTEFARRSAWRCATRIAAVATNTESARPGE